MRMPALFIAAATALVLAAPAHAKVIQVAPGENAQTRLQEALILAAPGDVVELGVGRFVLTDGLSLDVKGVTVRGAGMEATVLDFTGQKGSGEGLLVTSDDVTLRDFAVENTKGDGIKSKGADNIVYYRVRVTWTGGAKTTNGAYGIYPVESTGVLIDGCKVSGASDAGIYVGQSRDITVRYSLAEYNVAGIEIENSRNALVTGNLTTRNTGGILVFDLPNLPVMGGGNVVVTGNMVVDNDTPNFAPKGNIVAGVMRGTGIMVMANEGVVVSRNRIDQNPTTAVMVVSYPNKFDDARYNPAPRDVFIAGNQMGRNGYDPQLEGAAQ
ncbi:MAG: right-handed parallel beta-helix repeat-containing protein, partial [Brevundimonas sp.]|nr:right-handed parallel beta-helix repeat-containing protein [Brevundimonas sp.]